MTSVVREVVRGNQIVVASNFYQPNGAIATPGGAEVCIVYNTANSTANVTITMVQNAAANAWTANWDTTIAYPGVVSWVTYTTDVPRITNQGQFTITAGPANQIAF